MKTILVDNQKGGVGKSLVADEFAFSFERSGISVSFYNLNAQGGPLHRTHEADRSQVAVVDTPGALQEALSGWLREADEDCLRDERVESLQGVPGDAGARGHGTRGCGLPEGITAGQSRVPYGQIEARGI